MKNHKTVDEYIANQPELQANALSQIRKIVKEVVPEAEESFAYGMPAYKLNGEPLVYFAGFKSHIGFYPTPTGVESFKKELSKYKQGKGSVQFPLSAPMPFELIKKIVESRVRGK